MSEVQINFFMIENKESWSDSVRNKTGLIRFCKWYLRTVAPLREATSKELYDYLRVMRLLEGYKLSPSRLGHEICNVPGFYYIRKYDSVSKSIANFWRFNPDADCKNLQNEAREKTSKYPGVYWNKSAKKWHVQIMIKGKQKYLGLFRDEEEAAEVYQKSLNERDGVNGGIQCE